MSPETQEYVQQMKDKHGEINLISKGSSIKFCIVAEGQADCYPRFAQLWNGTLQLVKLCEHAGYKVIDLVTKKEMLYNRSELLNNSFLVR